MPSPKLQEYINRFEALLDAKAGTPKGERSPDSIFAEFVRESLVDPPEIADNLTMMIKSDFSRLEYSERNRPKASSYILNEVELLLQMLYFVETHFPDVVTD